MSEIIDRLRRAISDLEDLGATPREVEVTEEVYRAVQALATNRPANIPLGSTFLGPETFMGVRIRKKPKGRDELAPNSPPAT